MIEDFFKNSCNFLRKQQKTISGTVVSFEGKEASGNENEYNLFYGKWSFEYFFLLTIFSKKATFLEKIGEKLIFLGEGVVLR